jgi:Rrf2 family transcriptional repressor of oqxAB
MLPELKNQGGPVNPVWFAMAVQVLVFLNRSHGEVCPSATIADQVRSHAVFLRRIVAYLVRAGIVEAREGREGGYRLARAAEQITLAEVYHALQATGEGGTLPIIPERGPQLEPGVRAAFREIGEEFDACIIDVLSKRTLADVARRAEAAESC